MTSQTLSDELLNRQQTYRQTRLRQYREDKKRERRARRAEASQTETKALCRAKRRAQEILDLSASDIDDLLDSADSGSSSDDENETSVS